MSHKDSNTKTELTAMEAAAKYLSTRMRTVSEVRDHLSAKGYTSDEIDETVNDLIGLRYLDAYQYALRYYEYNREKHRGSLRAARELSEKGVDPETVRYAREDFLYSNKVDEYEDLKVDRYEKREVEFVLQLMRKFKMSYELKRKKEFIPALIGPNSPIEMPDVSEYAYHLCYEFEYLSLPDSLLHQLMVKCIANYTLDPIWKEGFVLNDASRNTLVIVKRGLKENTLILDAYSDNKKELPISLQWVANQIRETGKTLDPKEYIMPNPDAKPDDRDRFNVAEIIKKLNRGKKEIDGITKDYPIIELLGEYYTKEAVQQAQMFVMERHEQLDPSILHTTVSNTINVYGNYIHGEEIIYTDKQLIQSIENDPIKCLLELKEHQDELPDS